jgi:hypothetical protein
MSLLGKYRREERDRDDEDETTATRSDSQTKTAEVHPMVAVPNKERKSPIMSFSVSSDLRSCLQTIRNKRAINLSMWVERVLREAAAQEFPNIADEILKSDM